MATVNLYLKDYQAKKSVVRAVINDGRNFQMKIYSGISVKPKHWSKANKCVLSANPDAVALNEHLKEFRSKVLSAYLEAKREGVKVTPEYFKKEIWPEEVEELSYWKVWEIFLETKKSELNSRSLGKYLTLEGHLKAFEVFTRQKLDLAKIDEFTLNNIQQFCYVERHLNTQSTDKNIGFLKSFLNWSLRRSYTDNSQFQNFRSLRQPESLKVIISDEEIQQLENVEVGDKKYLSNARELFILSCLTGLRFSDYSRVQRQHFKEDSEGTKVLMIRQTKTNDFVEIPLTPRAVIVVKGLINGTVHSISNQKMNKYVKELCMLAGIDEECEVHTYVGKARNVEIKPKYDLVSTHTGRRTFATKLLSRGVPAETVMQFTGHRDYKSFSSYVNIPKAAQKKAVKEAMFDSFMKVTA